MRLISLCIDRDDDLGKKAGIKGPIFGEKKCIEAAIKLGIKDPEDSDVNSFLACVKEFKENKNVIDCVILTGHPKRGVKADVEILKQLEEVLKKYPNIDGCIFVSDGSDDEQLIPVISNKIKIISIKQVIVKQQRELEKGYYVIKEAIKDPDMAKIFLGIPGIIIFLLSFGEIGFRFVMFTIGTFLILRGFGIDKKIYESILNILKTSSLDNKTFPIYLGSTILFLLSVISAWITFQKNNDKQLIDLISIIGINTVPILYLSYILFSIGRMIDKKENIKKKIIKIIDNSMIFLLIYLGLNLIYGYLDFFWFLWFLIGGIILNLILKKIFI